MAGRSLAHYLGGLIGLWRRISFAAHDRGVSICGTGSRDPEQSHEPRGGGICATLSRPHSSLAEIAAHWTIILNLLAGSLLGSWLGAGWVTRLKSDNLYRVIAVLLVVIAAVLMFGHDARSGAPLLVGVAQAVAGIAAGFVIGVVASLLGVAGGELLIPTLLLLFGVDIKLAGSLSLAVSLPTMLVGFTRYSRDQSFSVLGRNKAFLLVMAAGSIVGTLIGGLLLGVVSSAVLLPALAAILVISAVKVWKHG